MSSKSKQTFTLLLNMLLVIGCVQGSSRPPRIDQNPLSVLTVNISDPVTLECRVSGDPEPVVTWYKNERLLDIAGDNKYTLIRGTDLFIISAKVGRGEKSDSGDYFCKATNEHGQVSSGKATLLVTYLKDDFRAIPKSRQINSGSAIVMDCTAPRGSPEPLIWWEKNGMPLKLTAVNRGQYEVFANGTFLIQNATLIDNGEYQCVAQNDAGVRKSAPAYLNVFEAPSFLVKPTTGKYEAGRQVKIECQANGFPKPLIEWKKDNSVDNIPLKAQIRDNTLIIPSLDQNDEGEYTCLASNQLGSIESKSYLIVYEKPTFTKVMSNLTIGIESKSLTIECNARGKPAPIIYWAKSGQVPSVGNEKPAQTAGQDDFIILENGNLFIERLSQKYEGTYLCQASNEYGSIETKTSLIMKSVQSKPPPIIVYGPQNQTIPINTQATLECLTTTAQSRLFSDNEPLNTPKELQSQYLANEKVQITWLKDSLPLDMQHPIGKVKYYVRDTGSLEVSSVQDTDTGVYRCMATNFYGQTHSMPAMLRVENPNNQYAEFQRNFETTVLPSAPTQPVILLTTATSVSLSWQASAHSGHSPLVSYTIEFFSPEWPQRLPGWVVVAKDLPTVSSFTVEGLVPDTYYMFMIRAKNSQGYGPPSKVSDLTKTLFEPQSIIHTQNSNEILERALTGEVIQLNEPAHVLSSTSISLNWTILKSASLIEGFHIKYKPIGAKHPYKTLAIKDKHKRSAVLTHLAKFTPYEILIEPFSGPIRGSESNIVQAKTLEDLPTQSPLDLDVQLDSITSMSVKWQPPPANHMNGVILGYKISCIANETKFSLNLNTNSTTRAIIIGNLIKDMKYCVQVAAFTKKGTGPFTVHKCLVMSKSFLANLEITKNPLGQDKFHEVLGTPWLIAIVIVMCIVVLLLMLYCVWFMVRRIGLGKKQRKYLSTSSENGSINGGQHKMDGGNRYKLVNDNIWLDTLHSGSNQSNQECCCVPDLHHQIFVQQSNGTRQLLHDPSLDPSLKSKFHSDTCTQHTNSTNTQPNSNNSSQQPQYAEIYGPPMHQMNPQHNTNPYASSGLFMNDTNDENGTNNPYNIINYQTMGNSRQQLLQNNYTMKLLVDKLQAEGQLTNVGNATTMLNDQKKLLKYLQQQAASQSQTNTPRVVAKNLQNRVKSENHGSNFCPAQMHAQQQLNLPSHQGHQMITYLSDNQTENLIANEALRNFLEINHNSQNIINHKQQTQQQQPNSSSTPIPSLPLQPPPSLASALIAQQHTQLSALQQKQLIDGYNNLLNTISRTQQQQSPVQYNMPWNGTNTSAFTNTRLQHNPSNTSSLVNSLMGQSTLSRAQQVSSTFTAQQYANRALKQTHMTEQQDYSSISPVEDLAEAEIEALTYKAKQYRGPVANPNGQNSWTLDTNSNPILGSYESTQTQMLSNSLNSSDLSKRSEEGEVTSGQLHYANQDLGEEKKNRFQPIMSKRDSTESSELYISDMPQTIL